MKKGFGDLFGESWKEYKSSFGLFSKLFVVFYLIPSIILSALTILFFRDVSSITAAESAGEALDLLTEMIAQSIGLISLSLFFMVFYLIMGIAFIYVAIFKQKNTQMSFGQAVKGGLNYFWVYIGLSLLLIVFLIPLFLLFIIPGLIFAVYWSFAPYVLINEKKVFGNL